MNEHTYVRTYVRASVRHSRPIAITSREKKETSNNRQTYIGFENIAGYFRDELANIIYSAIPL